MDLHQIHREDVFGPSLGQVLMSRSKVKGHGHQGQNTRCALPSPPWESCSSRRNHSVAAREWFQQPVCGLCLV